MWLRGRSVSYTVRIAPEVPTIRAARSRVRQPAPKLDTHRPGAPDTTAVDRCVEISARRSAVEAKGLEELRIPRAVSEDPRALWQMPSRCRRDPAAEQLFVEVVAERDEARGGAEHVGLLLREPSQFRRPVARVDLAAGAGMHRIPIDARRSERCLRRRPSARVPRRRRTGVNGRPCRSSASRLWPKQEVPTPSTPSAPPASAITSRMRSTSRSGSISLRTHGARAHATTSAAVPASGARGQTTRRRRVRERSAEDTARR